MSGVVQWHFRVEGDDENRYPTQGTVWERMDEQLNTVPMIAANLNYPPAERCSSMCSRCMHAHRRTLDCMADGWCTRANQQNTHPIEAGHELRPGPVPLTLLAQLGDTDTPPLNSLVGQLSIQAFTAAWVQPLWLWPLLGSCLAWAHARRRVSCMPGLGAAPNHPASPPRRRRTLAGSGRQCSATAMPMHRFLRTLLSSTSSISFIGVHAYRSFMVLLFFMISSRIKVGIACWLPDHAHDHI